MWTYLLILVNNVDKYPLDENGEFNMLKHPENIIEIMKSDFKGALLFLIQL